MQVETEQQGSHQHGDGDGESVGCLHVRGVAEEQDDENHADVHGEVDHRDIELPLNMGRMLDSHARPEVQVHGFAQYGEGPLMSAWLATSAAPVAMMIAKNSMLCGMMAKNGFTASAVSA